MANQKALQLNDKKILAMKKPESKKWIRDGNGLALYLTSAKKGTWRFWYYIYISPETKKKTYKLLGSYPEMGLAAARAETAQLAGNIVNMIDPKAEERRELEAKIQADQERRRIKDAEEKELTVAKLVDEYLATGCFSDWVARTSTSRRSSRRWKLGSAS